MKRDSKRTPMVQGLGPGPGPGWISRLGPLRRFRRARGLALCVLTCLSAACRRQSPLIPYTAYVLNQHSPTLVAVNLADFHVTARLPVIALPERVLVRPHARQLYVVAPSGKITVAVFPHLQT